MLAVEYVIGPKTVHRIDVSGNLEAMSTLLNAAKTVPNLDNYTARICRGEDTIGLVLNGCYFRCDKFSLGIGVPLFKRIDDDAANKHTSRLLAK